VNLAVAATTLAFIIPAELPDKTFVSCIVLSSRYRGLLVWLGAASALVLQAGIAVLAGGLLALLPHRVVEGVVAVLFFTGAAYLLLIPERKEAEAAMHLAASEEQIVEGGQPAPGKVQVAPKAWRVVLTTFGIVALAEFGDITQVLIANFAARYHDPLSVFTGAAVGFCLVAVVGVVGGSILARRLSLAWVRRISGTALAGFGIYSIVTVISG
jgi:putative Ca2+/H+ antiporter (TMEM165/GDT1 family)